MGHSGLLKFMHKLFKDTPARRENFVRMVDCSVVPEKHCPTRWIENFPAAKNAIEILPHFKKYVKTIVQNPKKCNALKTKSFEHVKDAVQDPLMLIKLQFFVSLAGEF